MNIHTQHHVALLSLAGLEVAASEEESELQVLDRRLVTVESLSRTSRMLLTELAGIVKTAEQMRAESRSQMALSIEREIHTAQ